MRNRQAPTTTAAGTEEPDVDIADCSYGDEGLIVSRAGNRRLQPETSKSYTAGFVFSPLPTSTSHSIISISTCAIRYRIYASTACCRTRRAAASARSSTARVSGSELADLHRRARARELQRPTVVCTACSSIRSTSRASAPAVLDFSTHYRLETAIGLFRFSGNYTWVRKHESQQYRRRSRSRISSPSTAASTFRARRPAPASAERDRWTATLHGERLGRLPNSDSASAGLRSGGWRQPVDRCDVPLQRLGAVPLQRALCSCRSRSRTCSTRCRRATPRRRAIRTTTSRGSTRSVGSSSCSTRTSSAARRCRRDGAPSVQPRAERTVP